jgi:hypothetical protein
MIHTLSTCAGHRARVRRNREAFVQRAAARAKAKGENR